MKASDRPQISKKWWTSEKPSDIKGAELEKALQAAEKALADEKRKSDERSIEAAAGALADMESAVDKTVKKECDKKKHKDVITVLEKFYDLIKAETQRLEEAKEKQSAAGEDGEEEEDDNKLFDKEYVYKMIKIMKSGGTELRFGFGLNPQTPESSRLVLARKGKPERLFKALKKTGDYSNRLMTYGYAMPDPQSGKTLVFRLEESAGEPPQIVKLGRRFLRNDNKLYFRKIKVVLPGGQTVEDDEPDTEEGAQEAAAEQASSAAAAQPASDEAAAAAQPASEGSAEAGAAPPESSDVGTQGERRTAEPAHEAPAGEESAAATAPSDQASADPGAPRPDSDSTTQTRRRSAEEVQQILGRIERELQEIMASLSA
jgi:hypothetical protein